MHTVGGIGRVQRGGCTKRGAGRWLYTEPMKKIPVKPDWKLAMEITVGVLTLGFVGFDVLMLMLIL